MPSLSPTRIDAYGGEFHVRPAAGWPDDLVGAAGPFRLAPAALAIPSSASDVQSLVRWAASEGHHLTARGAATGMPGGNVGSQILVDLRSNFRSVLSVDPAVREITVQAGVTVAEVEAAAAAHGLTFPVQPSSLDRCVIGGVVANNASGPRSLKHGSVRRWVRRVTAVLADGSLARLEASEAGHGGQRARTAGRVGGQVALASDDPLAAAFEHVDDPDLYRGWPAVLKNSSGYALDRAHSSRRGLDLFVGSEGTLGLATEITLALDAVPQARATILVAVHDTEEISEWGGRARALGAAACEFIGFRLIELAKLDRDLELSPVVRGADALVLIELEGDPASVDSRAAALSAAAAAEGNRCRVAASTEEAASLWGLRRRASPAIRDAAAVGLRSMQFIEDSVVPPARLPEYIRGVQAILAQAGTDGAIFGHAGEANVHVNPLIDLRRTDWPARVRTILEETANLVAELGGTLSGEHGDGRVRAPFLTQIWGEPRARAFRALKERLDPDRVLNPGVKIPLAGQDPLEGLEHLERSRG